MFDNSEKIENRFNIKIDKIEYDAKFVFSEIGYNFEPSEVGASFGLVQLKKLKRNNLLRKRNFNNHMKYFNKFNEWFILPKQEEDINTGWLAFPLIISKNAPFTRKEIQIFLEKRNIQTRVIFTGNILRQPGFKNIKCKVDKKGYKNADYIMKNGFMIAVHHGLNKKMIKNLYSSFDMLLKLYN